mmetsp:Transcript_23884/g.35042  ORF Transcript_23884/g.35042 Transcript_23884/m.35042 type:complete len:321 (+) Transcript_23884:108-1070(+)|eukprot:CAMPEP_0185031200 /NCGR_PEP_ID=MMETSP1103-20130426/18534_1 /TAXON_ID=36769 /ORGANISM="Paraphysomonas bandaiensis, Strain Caron Lab Isolate" /LENGTH=320 /DNA_ID=CAMNT_0027566641 /DNA_START=51 /DNA_END=1013 /DNA_ORIENTATION=-
MKRWSDEESRGLEEIRGRLHDQLLSIAQNPEVVGDRKLLRFFRGHNYDIDKTIEMIAKYIEWRKQSNVDEIRHDIVYGGKNHPSKFPNGEKILRMVPQIVIDPNICDKTGSPICVEQYNFSPAAVLQEISIEEYIVFVTYSLEYKSLILEQLSEAKERKRLQELKKAEAEGKDISQEDPYGVILHTCVIRDLNGVGFEHLGSQGQEIIKAVIGVASDNYPELMHKCHMINVPWLFNTVWWVIRGWIAARTLAKVNVLGTSFSSQLSAEIDITCLPARLGGKYEGESEPFEFDISEGGLLWTPESGDSSGKTLSESGQTAA